MCFEGEGLYIAKIKWFLKLTPVADVDVAEQAMAPAAAAKQSQPMRYAVVSLYECETLQDADGILGECYTVSKPQSKAPAHAEHAVKVDALHGKVM